MRMDDWTRATGTLTMSADEPRAVHLAHPTPTCPSCGRDLEMRPELHVNGKIHVAFVCARHGSFPNAWRRKFVDDVRANAWAHQQRQAQLAKRR